MERLNLNFRAVEVDRGNVSVMKGWRAGLLTILELAWKKLFIAALMAPANQA